MAASLYIDDNLETAPAGYPLAYTPVDSDAQIYVARRSGGWRISRSLGLIPLIQSDTSDPNFLLFNPATASPTTIKNQLVAMRFRVSNTADQIGIVARGNNSACNGFLLLYNGSANLLQLARFFNSGGLQFGSHDTESWTPTVNTDYWLFLYARSTDASNTTLRGWVTTDTAKQTPLTSLVTATDSLAELQTSGFWGPFTLSYNDGSAVSRVAMWTVDGTYTALGFVTNSSSGSVLEAFSVDGTGPFTYQWQKASTPAGSYSNITGATTARYAYTDGAVGVTEYAKCVITDTGNGNATATTAAFPMQKTGTAIAIGVARDSYGARFPNADDGGNYTLNTMPETMGKLLGANLNRQVTIVNGSVSGITAATFVSTYMSAWITNLQNAGAQYAEIAFGANSGSSDANETDSNNTATSVVSDIEDICDALIAVNIRPVVSSAQYFSPTGRSGRGAQQLRTMELINDKLFGDGGLVDGTTILAGDSGHFDYMAANPGLQVDMLHANEWANQYIASRLSARFTAIIDSTALGIEAGDGSQYSHWFTEGVAAQSTVDDIETDTQNIQSRLPAALVSGRMDSNVQAMGTGVVTSDAIAPNAIGSSEIADGAITAAKIADNAIDTATFAAGTTLPRVTLVDTVTTLTEEISGGASAEDIAEALAGTANINIFAPATGSTLDLYKGDDYTNDNAIDVTKQANETHWPGTLSTVHLYAEPATDTLREHADAVGLDGIACTVVDATGDDQEFTISLTAAQTLTLQEGSYNYEFWIVANKATAPKTIRSGVLRVRNRPSVA